ncbi:MAG: hypothetical protein J6565_07625 [Lactobacillus sp.]|nr:hypothetical protein [Lactobacillus sp.]
MENTNFYNDQNLIEIKNKSHHKKGQLAVAPIEAAAFFMIASASLVNSSTNYISEKPKQQIIQAVQEMSDVDMSNDKSTSTQEVRQKDLDNLEKLFEQKIETINEHIDGQFNLLNQKIEATINELNKEADRRYKRINFTIAIVGIVAPIIAQLVFKYIK